MGLNNGTFLDACLRRNHRRLPIWIMRQAGRYLPEYQTVREKVSFKELCKTPELIADVVEQPVKRFGFDAAILFSDILTMLEPMGFSVDFSASGPRIERPIAAPGDIEHLKIPQFENDLSFVFEGIRQIKDKLPATPLIGFAGSPFTLACYLIEGQGSKTFNKTRQFLQRHPLAAGKLIDILTEAIAQYLHMQVDAGVDAVQLFQSWDGILSREDYRKWSAIPANRIFSALSDTRKARILFVNNIAPYIDIVSEIDCEVAGVDYRIDLAAAARALPGKALQGNLDPSILFGSPEKVYEQTTRIIDSLNDLSGLIFNLGHGIQPGTPIEAVESLVEAVHNYR